MDLNTLTLHLFRGWRKFRLLRQEVGRQRTRDGCSGVTLCTFTSMGHERIHHKLYGAATVALGAFDLNIKMGCCSSKRRQCSVLFSSSGTRTLFI